MIFTDLPNGAAVFLDGNTLVYHFQPHPGFVIDRDYYEYEFPLEGG